MREVIERGGVGVIELEGRDGNGAVADSGYVRVGLDVLNTFLLVQPEITAAAGIGAGLEHVARDL